MGFHRSLGFGGQTQAHTGLHGKTVYLFVRVGPCLPLIAGLLERQVSAGEKSPAFFLHYAVKIKYGIAANRFAVPASV